MRQPKPHHGHQPKFTKSKHMKCLPIKPHFLRYSAKRTSGKSRGFDLWLEHRWNYPAAHYLKMQSARLQLICHSEKALRFYDENSFMRCSQNISPLTFPIYLTFAALPWQTFMCDFKAMEYTSRRHWSRKSEEWWGSGDATSCQGLALSWPNMLKNRVRGIL